MSDFPDSGFVGVDGHGYLGNARKIATLPPDVSDLKRSCIEPMLSRKSERRSALRLEPPAGDSALLSPLPSLPALRRTYSRSPEPWWKAPSTYRRRLGSLPVKVRWQCNQKRKIRAGALASSRNGLLKASRIIRPTPALLLV